MFGGYVLTYRSSYNTNLSIYLVGPLLLIQLILSAFALVFKWDDELTYSLEATRDYNLLSQDFKMLRQFTPIGLDELIIRYNILDKKNPNIEKLL